MKLPAVAIAALFACGVVLGQTPWLAGRISSHTYLTIGFAGAGILICAGIFLARIGRLFRAATFSILSWIILGVLGAGVANLPRPADYILSLVEAGRVDLKTPLRWHGRLRDEPAQLPWGYGYEIELTGVEYEGSLVPARGGLRVSFSENPEQIAAPDVHAGDEIVVATQAKRPQVFRDDGAFDRRAYLAAQNVDLVATLRAPGLMERTAASRTTAATLLAHVRRRLRDEIDELFAKTPQVGGVVARHAAGRPEFCGSFGVYRFSEDGRFPCVGCGRLARGGAGGVSVLDGTCAETHAALDGTRDAHSAIRVCGRGGAEAASASRGLDDCNRSDWGIVFSATRFIELRGNSGAYSADCKAAGCARFELSTYFSGDWLHRGAGSAVAREDSATLCRGSARLARRYSRRSS